MLTNTPIKSVPTKYEIESLARSYGMVYKDEILKLSEPAGENVDKENQVMAEQAKPEPDEAGSAKMEPEIRRVVIPKGSSSEKITDILLETGAIEEPKEFTRRIRELGVTNRLNAGQFEIPTGLTVDEIIDILTVGGRG
ncbi:MAG: hypothetical protein WDA53_02545 [Bacillota bacterium]